MEIWTLSSIWDWALGCSTYTHEIGNGIGIGGMKWIRDENWEREHDGNGFKRWPGDRPVNVNFHKF